MDRKNIDQVIEILAEDIGGDWVLLGGSLALAVFGSTRATEDIDVVGYPPTQESRTRLLEAAGRIGLPVEALNSAADYFLQRIPGWRNELVELRAGKKGRILRPNLTLYFALKLMRGTEADISDCRKGIEALPSEKPDKQKISIWLKALKRTLSKDAEAFLQLV